MEQLNRYSRQMSLPEIGTDGQLKLLNAKVLVIGAGGLGCPVLQMLAASGVGTIGVVDGDVVQETNLHRQLLYSIDDCGKSKVNSAVSALRRINSAIVVNAYPVFANEYNVATISSGYDILVDCTDSVAVRYLINDIAVFSNKPMIYSSVHKFEGQLSVFNFQNGPSYRCLFPEKVNAHVSNCSTEGVLGVVPNTLGMLQANEVLKIILGVGTIFSGKLLVYNALHFSFNEIEFEKNPEQIKIGLKNGRQLTQNKVQNYELDKSSFIEKCNNEIYSIIDLREPHELPKLTYESVINVPFSEIENYQNQLLKNQNIILFCQSGQRSKKALQLFRRNGFTNVLHLQNGIQSFQLEVIS